MAPPFTQVFSTKKPIIGMIHCAGNTPKEKTQRALEELTIYQEEGIDGAIVEDYHGEYEDVYQVLQSSKERYPGLVIGLNLLRKSYPVFGLAQTHGIRYIQFDSIPTSDITTEIYDQKRREFPDLAILGGVGFKYIPATGNPLQHDLEKGRSRYDAIVTTGTGTGIETPLEKLRQYKSLLGQFPLIVGAGVTASNAYEQLSIADGAIVGSYFKSEGDTQSPVKRHKVRELMKIVRQLR